MRHELPHEWCIAKLPDVIRQKKKTLAWTVARCGKSVMEGNRGPDCKGLRLFYEKDAFRKQVFVFVATAFGTSCLHLS
jgi:hypothetical protein